MCHGRMPDGEEPAVDLFRSEKATKLRDHQRESQVVSFFFLLLLFKHLSLVSRLNLEVAKRRFSFERFAVRIFTRTLRMKRERNTEERRTFDLAVLRRLME